MPQTFIVGRNGNQPFKIMSDAVSAEHARITHLDNGEWYVEDLKGDTGNGTFTKNSDGDFIQIYNKKVDENTIIRLGKGGHHSYLFMIHHLLEDPDDYEYEFKLLREQHRELHEKLLKVQRKNKIILTAQRIIGPIVSVLILSLGLGSGILMGLLRASVTLVLFLVIFKPDKKGLLDVQQRMKKLITCPKCGKTLSEHELQNRICLSCHAKG
jgi:hypothetical protein